MPDLHLTKSRYTAGLQCRLRLWKQAHTPQSHPVPAPGTPQFEGTRIGRAARDLFPGGVLVVQPAADHAGAVEETKTLMAGECPAIFEAAFEHGDCRVRVDILARSGAGDWDFYEVKSSTSPHREHYEDVAFQVAVLQGAGVRYRGIFIVHVNGDYRRGEGPFDPVDFFRTVDVRGALRGPREALASNLPDMSRVLRETEPPVVTPGLHCRSPHTCEFQDECAASLPEDWVGYLPRVTAGQMDALAGIDVTRLGDIPDSVGLRGIQTTVRQVHRTGEPFIAAGITRALAPFRPPASYLDFESMMPGLPLFPGTSPYQHIPFLFSLHHLRDGILVHEAYIAPPGPDPRRGLAKELVRRTSDCDGPLVVYSPYEKRVIAELARAFPDLAPDLGRLSARLRDLLAVVRQNVYLPAFNGSFSIKEVAPALAPDVDYANLHVRDGATAAAVYQRLVEGPPVPADQQAGELADLVAYCGRDTFAMVRVHQALVDLARRGAVSLKPEA